MEAKYSLRARMAESGLRDLGADSLEMLTNNLILPKLSLPHSSVNDEMRETGMTTIQNDKNEDSVSNLENENEAPKSQEGFVQRASIQQEIIEEESITQGNTQSPFGETFHMSKTTGFGRTTQQIKRFLPLKSTMFSTNARVKTPSKEGYELFKAYKEKMKETHQEMKKPAYMKSLFRHGQNHDSGKDDELMYETNGTNFSHVIN